MTDVLIPYLEELDVYKNTVIGSTAVKLEGDRTRCRLRECNLGNLYTDACVHAYLQDQNAPAEVNFYCSIDLYS